MNDTLKMYGSIGSEIMNRYFVVAMYSKVNQDGVDCKPPIYIYSCSARQISFQIEKFEFDLKRNSSGSTAVPLQLTF